MIQYTQLEADRVMTKEKSTLMSWNKRSLYVYMDLTSDLPT